MRDPRTVVRKALITEKGTALRELRNQYHFEVARDANKIEIRRAVERLQRLYEEQHQWKEAREVRVPEGDHVVVGRIAEADVEIVKIPTCCPHDDDFFNHKKIPFERKQARSFK